MTTPSLKILILHDRPDDFREWLEGETPGAVFRWVVRPGDVGPALEEFRPEVVFSIKHSGFPGPAHTRALTAPSVKWFQVGGSGTDHLGSWDPAQVIVTNCAGVLAPFHAERALAGLLALSTGLGDLMRAQAQKRWAPTRFSTLSGKTLVVVGFGHTGRALAVRARALGMRVVAVVRSKPGGGRSEGGKAEVGAGRLESGGVEFGVGRLESGKNRTEPVVDRLVTYEQWPEILREADVLSLNVPLTTATEHLVGKDQFQLVPEGCIVLNGSRGAVVDQQALVSALGRLGGVWLDVTDPEPLPCDSPLWHHPKVIITPHCADQVEDFPFRYARYFFENLQRYKRGEELTNLVNP